MEDRLLQGHNLLKQIDLEGGSIFTATSPEYVEGFAEVIWKEVAVILNLRFTAAITYHESLYIFWACCGKNTSTLKVNLLQQVVALK